MHNPINVLNRKDLLADIIFNVFEGNSPTEMTEINEHVESSEPIAYLRIDLGDEYNISNIVIKSMPKFTDLFFENNFRFYTYPPDFKENQPDPKNLKDCTIELYNRNNELQYSENLNNLNESEKRNLYMDHLPDEDKKEIIGKLYLQNGHVNTIIV